MAKIDSNILEIMANIIKSPADAVAIVKGSNGEMSTGTIAGIVGMTSSLASIVATNPELKAGLSKLGLGASVVGVYNDVTSLETNNYDDKTITSLAANTLAVAGGIVALGSAPAIGAALLVAGTGLALWSAYETGNDISDGTKNMLNDLGNQIEAMKESLGEMADNLGDLVGDIADVFSDISPQYNFLNTSERQGLAYQIANGDLSGLLYGAYNPSNSFVPIRRNDPLVLDLNGDGIINTISMTNSKAFFDTNGDGMKELTGWISGEDGILVYDKNGNGTIDDVSEVFGNSTLSGYTELRQLFDANKDNVIDNKDTNFSQLKVWQEFDLLSNKVA